MRSNLRRTLMAALLLLSPLSVFAATSDFKVLLDTDNSSATGCIVATPGGTFNGMDVVLTTTVNTTASSASVTAVTYQQCLAGGNFGAAVSVDPNGWPVGFNNGNLLVETRIPFSAFPGGTLPMNMRAVFTASSGSSGTAVLQRPNGARILWPVPPGRRHIAEPPPLLTPRTIVMDGVGTDWDGLPPLVNGDGASGNSSIKFSNIYAFFDAHNAFFRFDTFVDGSGPTAVNDTYGVRQGHGLTVVGPGVLGNDLNPSGQTMTTVLVSNPQHGTLTLNADGGFTYQHDGSASTQDQFTYKARSGGVDSNTATVTLNISPDNVPHATNDAYAVVHGGTLTVPAPGVLANDFDLDADPLTAVLATGPLHGTLTLNANGSFTYVHNGSNTLSDTFTYRASDGITQSTPATVTITVGPDAAPVAVNDAYTVAEGATLTVNPPGLFANDTDADTPIGQWTATVVTPPTHGTLNLTSGGGFVYVHDGSETTSDSFVYHVSDGIAFSNNATVTITVTPVNDAPVANDDSYSTNEDTPLTVPAPGVLGNDTDADSGSITATLVANVQHGTLALNPNGGFTYTPAANYFGPDSFTYTATDGAATSNTATVTINVVAVNDVPSFTAGTNPITVLEDSGAFSAPWATAISAGAANESGQTLNFIVSNNNNGLFSTQPALSPTGVLTFTPSANANGSATVNIQLHDNGGVANGGVDTSGTVVLTINVTAVNDAPSFTKGADQLVLENAGAQTVPGWATALSAGPADESGQALNFIVSNDNNAIFSVQPTVAANGDLTFTPLAGAFGVATVTVQIHDNGGIAGGGVDTSVAQTFTITVDKIPVITSANTTTFTAGTLGSFTVTTSAKPTASIARGGVALPAGVTFVDNGNGTGTLSGTPAAATGGTYAITFQGTNVHGSSAVQSFTLVVNEAPAVTSANNATFTVGSAGTFTVTTSGFPAAAIARGGVALPSGVTFVDNGNGTGTLSGTPAAATGGTYAITFTASNVAGTSPAQSFTLTVRQAPAITSANNATFTAGVLGSFSVTTTGFPAPSIARGGVALPAGVTFVDNGDGTGTLAGTPGVGTGGIYSITFTATNVVGSTPAQTFTLTVNEAPAVTSVNNATFTVGSAGTFTVTTSGFPAAAIARGGVALPSGVTFVDNGNGTGTLSGTPAAATGGTYAITFTASNVAGTSPAQSFTLTIRQAPAVTSANTATFIVGQSGTFTVTTSGFPIPSVARGGVALPSGLTFVDNGNGTGTLSGTPDPGTAAIYNITFTATNVVGSSAAQSFTLNVYQTPAVTSANNATFTVGSAGTFTVTTTGFPTPSIARGGVALPSGVTFVDNGNGTGTLSGTPAAATGGSYAITFTGTNAAGSSPVQSFTLTVNQAPVITSANTTTFLIGQAGTFNVTTTGFPAPSIARGGVSLPAGVTYVDNGNGTGTLSGTPQAGTGGSYAITFTATNVAGSSPAQSFTLVVNQAPAVTSANNTTFTVGSAGTFTVTTSGFPAPSIARGGVALPSGVTFVDNGNGTGTLSGTPGAGTGGTYAITFTATNVVGSSPAQSFTLTVNQAPAITSANNVTFTVGTPGSFNVTTTGFPAPSIARGGVALPAGITYVDNGNGTGTLSGTPQVGTGGSYAITFTATNVVGSTPAQSFTLTIQQAPAITSANNATFTVGSAGTFTVTTTGVPTPSIARGGVALPSGVTFVDNGNGTGTLSGTPGAGTGGTYAITFTATNVVGSTPAQTFTLTVNQAPAITSANNVTFTVGTPGTFTVTTTGFPPPSIARGGVALPAGVTFVDNGNGTGTLSGTPQVGTGGSYAITFTATNVVGSTPAQSFTLTIQQAPVITSANTVTFTVGAPGTFTVTTTGVPTPSIARGGVALPAGVTFVDNGNGTGTLSGTPAAATGGSYAITFTATNVAGSSPAQSFTLIVNQAPVITSANNATFTVGAAGTFTVTTTGFPAAAIARGGVALPAGVTFVDNGNGTGTLSGTPQAGTGGTYALTFTATNAAGSSPAQSFTLTVNQSPAITSANNATFVVGTNGPSFTVVATGFPAPTVTLTSGSLPAGLTFVGGVLSGTPNPNTGNIYALQFTASNGVAPDAIQSFTLTVNEAPQITSANNTTFTVGQAGTFTVTSIGYPAPGILESGTLPNGVTYNSGTHVLSGTPAPGTNGSYPLVFTSSNGIGADSIQNFTLTVVCAPITITPASLPVGTFNAVYSQVITASAGTAPYTITKTGTLPTGMTFIDNGNGTATLSGTPTQSGSFPLTVNVTDAGACPGTKNYTLVINPIANNDSYNGIGNTQVVGAGNSSPTTPYASYAASLLANDLGTSLTVTAVNNVATTLGGTITIAADGSFTYTPPVGVTATTDTYTYQLNSSGASVTGTVSFPLTNKVWYVKNDVAGTGTGRSHDPFKKLAGVAPSAENSSAAGDYIYVMFGDGTSANQNAGVTLKNNQLLVGSGVALTVNSINLAVAGTNPVISNTAGSAVTLANGNTVSGVTLSGATASGIAGSATNGATIDNALISGNGGSGISLTNAIGTVSIASTVTISNNTANGLLVSGGNGTITAAGPITANATQRSVNIGSRTGGAVTVSGTVIDNGTGINVANNTGGTVTFSGTQTLSTGSNTAVTLATNTGATTDFTGTLGITTTSGTGFSATGGGTVSVQGASNTISSSAGPGVALSAVTIGASNVTFRSVSAAGGGTGISLATVTGGTFNVTGTGVAGSGGSITSTTAGVSITGSGALTSNLTNVNISGGTTAISGTTFGTLNVTGVSASGATALNLTTGTLSGTFSTLTATGGTNGISLTTVGGTVSATGGTLSGSSGSEFVVSGGAVSLTYPGGISQGAAATAVNVSGGHTGTLTFNTGTINAFSGTGLLFDNADGTYNFNGTTTLNTGAPSVSAITIQNASAGTFSFNGSTNLTNGAAATSAFVVNSSTPAITYSGNITKTSTGLMLDITNQASGTITFQTGTLAASAGTGIQLANADGTVNFNGTTTLTGGATISIVAGTDAVNGSQGTFNFSSNTSVTNGTGGSFILTGSRPAVTYNGNLSQATAAQPLVAITSQGANTVTFQTGTLSATNGTGIQLSNVDGTVNFNGTTTISGGTQGISVSGGSGGTINVANGSGTASITNTTAEAVSVASSSPTFTCGGTITKSSGTRTILVNANTGGTISFTGSLTGTSTGGNHTVEVTSNTGATISFSGQLTLTSATGNALQVTGGGTITAANANNAATSVGGVAVNIANTTIGAGNVVFKSVNANGGAAGIIVDTTGATGTFSVTGSNALSRDGSGGTIQSMTGGDGTAAGHGIYLNSTKSPSFAHMTIKDVQGDGIHGNAVNGFSLVYSTITATGAGWNGTSTAQLGNFSGEGDIQFVGLSGAALIDNNALDRAFYTTVSVFNNGSQSINRFVFTNNTVGTMSNSGNDGLTLQGTGGTLNSTVSNNTFTSAAGDIFQLDIHGAINSDLIFQSNTITNTHPAIVSGGGGITIGAGGPADNVTLTFNISNNTMRDALGAALGISSGPGNLGAGSFTGTINNNVIGVAGVADSGSKQGQDLGIINFGAVMNINITNNQLYQYNTAATGALTIQNGDDGAHLAYFTGTITGNTISNPGTSANSPTFNTMNGIHLNSGPGGTDTARSCITIGGAGGLANSVSASSANGAPAIRLRQRANTKVGLPGYGGAANDTAAVNAFVSGNNGGAVVTSVTGTTAGFQGTCPP
jgi:VCBS repeat-containing protein